MAKKKPSSGFCVEVKNTYYNRFEHIWVEQWVKRTADGLNLEEAEAFTRDVAAMKVAWRITNHRGEVVQQSSSQ